MANVPESDTEFKKREWFEVLLLPVFAGTRSLACVGVGKPGDAARPIDNEAGGCLTFEAERRVVFGRSRDPAESLGVSVDVLYSWPTLTNEGGLTVWGPGDVVLDEVVSYGKASEGTARQLPPSLVELADPAVNDRAEAWCDATRAYHSEPDALGTPGEPNDPCPEVP